MIVPARPLHRPLVATACATLAALVTAGCATAPTPASAPAPASTAPLTAAAPAADYSQSANWLCFPGAQDACARELMTTVIQPNAQRSVEAGPAANAAAPIDCFYVYPTISDDPGGNSDLVPGVEERRVAQIQAAPFRGQCRVFAPMYRQVTLAGLRARFTGAKVPVDTVLPYGDVSAAWRLYMEKHNQGRGVVLIGHSQGARMVVELLKNEIEGKPVQRQLVSAMAIGFNFLVPRGRPSGGTLNSIPLCTSPVQTGCMVAYVSFRADQPPPSDALFGRAAGDQVVACTNPSALAGGIGMPRSMLPVRTNMMGGAVTIASDSGWNRLMTSVESPFVSLPGLMRTRCVQDENGSYLAVETLPDARLDDIGGDVIAGGRVLRNWGLHLVDMSVPMLDLVDLVGQQARAYAAKVR